MVPEDGQITSVNPAESLQSFGAENKYIPMSTIPQKKKKELINKRGVTDNC